VKKVTTKKQLSNVTVFLDLLKYFFGLFILLIIVSSYYGKWGELGFIAGLLTVALGVSLQKPISGIVAWLILVLRRSVHIGDRIIISRIIGDVTNITLTHIFLDEVGGTIDGEEQSGRIVMLPTSIIFEETIINYTHQDNYILDEVSVAVTYESNLEHAEAILKMAVNTIIKEFQDELPKRIRKEPHIRIQFKDSGMDLKVRYHTIVLKRNRIATDIRREIFNLIREAPDVEFAYPHTEVLLHEK
jgi:small-conductance mechanosensitive channel